MINNNISLLSVNVGKAERLGDGKPTKSGINKRPVEETVAVDELGLQGDAICNLKHHGGLDQAIYFYSRLDYAWWQERIGVECAPGLFGENFTVDNPESNRVCIGDRFVCGDVELEVTSPRIPCNTLNRRMNDAKFGPLFRKAERPGWYCRVIAPGEVRVGASITHVPYEGERITMSEAMRDYYLRSRVPLEQVERYLITPAHEKTLKLMQEIRATSQT